MRCLFTVSYMAFYSTSARNANKKKSKKHYQSDLFYYIYTRKTVSS